MLSAHSQQLRLNAPQVTHLLSKVNVFQLIDPQHEGNIHESQSDICLYTHHSHFIGYLCTCPLISSHHINSGVFYNWAPIVALTSSIGDPTRLVSATWQVGPTVLMCQLTWHANYACWRHDYIILTWVRHVGRVFWYLGRVSPFGQRRRVASRDAHGQPPRRRVMARASMFEIRFSHCFHQCARLFLLYMVVQSKHNFNNFYF